MKAFSPRGPLTRSGDSALLGGVCAGLARWLGWPLATTRLLYLLATFLTGSFPGLVAYLVLYVWLHDED